MTEASTVRMRSIFEAKYQRFRERLRRRLGSDALAVEVLHETWLRLDRIGDIDAIQKPEAYLFRMALNEAADRLGVQDPSVVRRDSLATPVNC